MKQLAIRLGYQKTLAKSLVIAVRVCCLRRLILAALFSFLFEFGIIEDALCLVPAVFCYREGLRLAFDFIKQQFCAGQGHGHTVAKMSAVRVEIGEARMPSDGGDVIRRPGTKACPMLHRHSIAPSRENLAHALQQAVARLNGGGFRSEEVGIP